MRGRIYLDQVTELFDVRGRRAVEGAVREEEVGVRDWEDRVCDATTDFSF